MTREVEQALREHRESERRLTDARTFVAKLETQQERLTILAELTAAWEAANAAEKAIQTPMVAPERAWTPPVPPANDPGLPEDGYIVDPASVDRLEAFVRGAEGGVSVAMAAAQIGVTKNVAHHTLRRLIADRGTIEYSRTRCRWYATGKMPAVAMTLGAAIEHVLAEGELLDPREIHERIREYIPTVGYASVRATVNRMEGNGALSDHGPSPRSRGHLYALRALKAAP